jgi:O-acetyl-ADP-ribose deacetylase (regulator of RNase III)
MVRFSDFSGVKHEEGTPSSSPSYREVHGDIFTSDAEAIVNTVNCLGAMGKGIALEFKKRYPDLYAAYRQACTRKVKSLALPWMGAMNGRIPVDEIKSSTRKILSGITDVEISVYEIRKNI